MISKVNLSTVTFSNEWRQILKSNNQNSKSFISIYLDLTEISNKSKDNFLFYNEHNDSVKNLLSVFDVMAAAITVGLYLLPTSFCTIRTGLIPPCSEPITGLKSA